MLPQLFFEEQSKRGHMYIERMDHACVFTLHVDSHTIGTRKHCVVRTSAASVDTRGFDSRKVTMLLTTSTLCSDEAFVVDICTDGQTGGISEGKAIGEKHYRCMPDRTQSPHPQYMSSHHVVVCSRVGPHNTYLRTHYITPHYTTPHHTTLHHNATLHQAISPHHITPLH